MEGMQHLQNNVLFLQHETPQTMQILHQFKYDVSRVDDNFQYDSGKTLQKVKYDVWEGVSK